MVLQAAMLAITLTDRHNILACCESCLFPCWQHLLQLRRHSTASYFTRLKVPTKLPGPRPQTEAYRFASILADAMEEDCEGAGLQQEQEVDPGFVDANCVEEAEEVNRIVEDVVNSQGDSATKVLPRWRAILGKYQEESHMLDLLLENIVRPLATLLRAQAMDIHSQSGDASSSPNPKAYQRVLGVCRLLNVLVTVRGYKTTVKFFPHEAADLEAVLDVLLTVRATRKEGAGSDPEDSLACWEAQMMLLLWLSMLILIPFDLATVDTAATLDNSQSHADRMQQPYTVLVTRILHVCKEYLHQPGGVREMAALLLGRLLTRPDQGAALKEFLEWSHQQLAAPADDQPFVRFLIPGVLLTLSFVFKLGKRSALLPHAPAAWMQLAALHAKQQQAAADGATAAAVGGMLARKLTIKLAQRVALTFVKPRLAPWRYQKADAGLDVEVRLQQPSTQLASSVPSTVQPVMNAQQQQHVGMSMPTHGDVDEDEDFELVEELEEVLDLLLTALHDKDTVVRWSAAKGVGRVTSCLPKALGDEVVAAIITSFKPTESSDTWHGGCLALAELARRGLLLPDRLPELTPIIRTALLYDVRRGPHSVGAHVRDAAAYVCWAFARAYAPDVMEGSVHGLASTLLIVACYDREVNCRRAAAAAFQECVGRLGNFPHGIDLMIVVDYFAVGNINNAYLNVAVQVAHYTAYSVPLAQHLLCAQLRHWEKQLRELTARGLAALVPAVGADYMAAQAVDTLLPLCTDAVLEVRHGAVVGLAELLPALHAAGMHVSQDHQLQVAGVVPAIDKARLYRGKGGEVMREAVSHLIAGMSAVTLPLSAAQHAKILEALDENLRHPQAVIQKAAVAALRQYTSAYLHTEDASTRFTRYYGGFLTRLHDPNVAVRRGYALALGALPAFLLAPRHHEVLDALIGGTVIDALEMEERDTESRANCVRALASVCQTLYGPQATAAAAAAAAATAGASFHANGAAAPSTADSSAVWQDAAHAIQDKVLPCLFVCLTDYTIDNRGDVGSWVREAAVEALPLMLLLLSHVQQQLRTDTRMQDVVPTAMAALLKQGVERIARLREAAMVALRALLAGPPAVVSAIPDPACVAEALPTDDNELTGVVSLEAVRKLAALLPVSSVYCTPLLEGLTSSVGGVDAQLAKAASAALVDVLQATVVQQPSQTITQAPPDTSVPVVTRDDVSAKKLQGIACSFVSIWRRHAKSARMASPLLRTADLLVTRCPEICSTHMPAGDTAEAQPQLFCEVIVGLARAETRQCSDITRLMDAAGLLCHLLTCPCVCRVSAYQGLLVLLANRYPKVRRFTAEQLYVALLPLDPMQVGGPEGGVDAGAVDQATELLLMTAWDDDIRGAQAARDALAAHLQVAVPAMKTAAVKSQGADRAATDEYASYQSLLDDFARGV